ncbi:MAG: UvrD-helicase domain-containing protein, partial [Chlamydiia bacterium]|nr:UvrD-helicase domain-containing protein [Chlamydiia bacterium]
MKSFDILDPQTPLLGHCLLEASAGTGKTFAIEHLTARLIEEKDFSIEEILVVTFTRAAARELKMRIHKTLKEKPLSFAIKRALALIDGAQIFTIHGFCHRMLSEYAFEAGLGFTLLSEEESDYRAILKDHVADFFRTSLSPEKYSTSQIASLLKFSRENQDKLTHKILSLVEKEGEFPHYPTFHASYRDYLEARKKVAAPLSLITAFNKIKNKHGEVKEPYQTQIALLEKETLTLEEFEQLIQEPTVLSLLTEENINRKATVDPSPLFRFRDALLPVLESASSPLCTLVRIARSVRSSARKVLEEKEILSPNDILKKMEEALSIPEFCHKVRSRFRAAIIDEFQDTDPIQWNIFKTLFINKPLPALYLVGDPKQSIYSFRSADIYTYLGAEKVVPNKGTLGTNYRSDPALIAALNALFSKNPDWLSLPDAPLSFQPVNSPAHATNKKFSDHKEPVHFFIYETEKKRERTWPSPQIEETVFFPFIVKEIRSLIASDCIYSDFAILVKDRFQGARLKAFLDKHDIPNNCKSTQSLTQTRTFQIVRALIEALISPNEKTVKRFLCYQVSHHELRDNPALIAETIALFSRPQTLCEALRDLYAPSDLDSYSDYLKLSELLLDYELSSHATLPEVLSFLLAQEELPRRPLADSNTVTIMTIHMSKGLEFNIVFALGLINRYTGREDFIRHQKEWLLFAPEHEKCQAALHDQEKEKLRQLYVALTRAKHRLYIPLLKETSGAPVPLGQASPLELFDPIPTDTTMLSPETLPLPQSSPPPLEPPMPLQKAFPTSFLQSYSSLAQTTPHVVPDISTQLPKGAETGILLHSL